jgi:hypothetical protein
VTSSGTPRESLLVYANQPPERNGCGKHSCRKQAQSKLHDIWLNLSRQSAGRSIVSPFASSPITANAARDCYALTSTKIPEETPGDRTGHFAWPPTGAKSQA